MALPLTSDPLLISQTRKSLLLSSFLRPQNPSISFSPISRFPSFRIARAISSDPPDRGDPLPPRIPIQNSAKKASEQIKKQVEGLKGITDEWGEKTEAGEEVDASTAKLPEADPPTNEDEWEVDRGGNGSPPTGIPIKDSDEKAAEKIKEQVEGPKGITDEWGEKTEAGAEEDACTTKLPEADPPTNEDEWEVDRGSSDYVSTNGSSPTGNEKGDPARDTLGDLKRVLIDSFYGTELGLRASVETRAEIVELVNQLEAANPTPAPTEASSLLNGNWVLAYTAFSELLPLIAAGALPLVKLKRISQVVDTGTQTVVNTATFSNPFATFSFSASASFEVRSPSRVQVQFKEGTFPPPEISPTINLPENIDLFGQKIDLLPVQRSLSPLQEVVANISRVISGQPALRVPIPGDRAQSFLVTTYLDEDLRISRGDGGLFVLVKEGSPLLEEQ